MKILVANLGSTSFKYRLFDMADERQLARWRGADWLREQSIVRRHRRSASGVVESRAGPCRGRTRCLEQLTDREQGCLADAGEVTAIGFKAVHAGAISGVQRVTPEIFAQWSG